MAIKQEFLDSEHELVHRLRCTETGRCTAWAPYTGYTYMDGMVGITAYYADKERILTAHEFFQLTAVR